MTTTLDSVKLEDVESEYTDTEIRPSEESHNLEKPSLHGKQSNISAIDYWYGKKYFEDVIAQEVFLSCAKSESSSSVDARFQYLMRHFPYHEAIKSLQTENPEFFRTDYLAAGNDGYYRLLTLVGATIRQGTAQERNQLLGTLKKSAGLRNGGVPKAVDPKPPSPSPLDGGRGSPPGNDTEIKNSIYTSILKEKADMRGMPLNYSFERLPQDPDTFRAELSFNGRLFHGVGRKKQEAKHQASKEACNFLESQREQLF